MITNFQEFECLFFEKENPVNSKAEFEKGTICIDLNNVIAFNAFTDRRYTVLRMIDGNSYIVRCTYDEMMNSVMSFAVRFEN